MWFKQIQLFQLPVAIPRTAEQLIPQLEALAFTHCPPSFPLSLGWAPLLEDFETPFVRQVNNCLLFCLKIEEKILPSIVVRQELDKRIAKIKELEQRAVRQKEKMNLKDDITMEMLPRAFSKMSRVYAYIDCELNSLVLSTTNKSITEKFLKLLKKTLTIDITAFETKNVTKILTRWVRDSHNDTHFQIEKSAMLQDPNEQLRTIRCQQQNLFSSSIQTLIKEGCEIKRLGLSWNDQVNLTIAHDFTIQNIKFQDILREQAKEMEPESALQQLDADFMIMSGIIKQIITELLNLFSKENTSKDASCNTTKI